MRQLGSASVVRLFVGLCVCLACVSADAVRDEADGSARRVKVLFLGDRGHHVPIERCRNVYSTFARRGIDFTYTEDLADLNPTTLGRYDALLLYANWTTIAPEQEKALLDYVESGHGFVPVHCASFCFLNSPKITALTGARFKTHETGVFKETIVAPDHPIEKGLNPIESWDETYVHEMHNDQGRTVLGYRVQGDHREPYTWVRTQGKGRVFYTAWGHDERTWTNADFQKLLERGIRWAAGDWALAPQPPAPPLKYVDAKIPNYIPNAAWGTTGQPISKMQEPLSPEESVRHMVVAPGFEVKLFTSEPQVKKPICMAFDERGRLWVAETFDYPNNMQRPGEGHDQITICEDTKGAGVADKFTVFADKLSIPTSMVFANGGVVVAQAPDMLFLKDSTGGDRADQRKVLFTGFGTHDTHAGPSNLRWGFDNWIYGTCGYSGFDGTVGGEHVQFGQGVFRFKPDGSKLEFLGSTTNNTWGLGLTEDNQVLGSTANGNPAWYLSVPNRYYEQLKGQSATRLEPIADTWHYFPVTDKIRQVDFWGGYTAGAGSALYTARSFPRSYWNRISFVTECTGHLVGQFVYERQGSGFRATNSFNLLASDDEWTAPIAAEVGPDGAVWMIDWYNFIVQHNPIPRGWTAGKGGAYETDLRDKRHGRVYRIVWKDGAASHTFDLSKAGPAQLVSALSSDNLLWRMHAQRLLVEHGDKSVVPRLIALVNDPKVDEIGLNPAAVHALWTLHALGVLDGSDATATAAVAKALAHPSASVRQAAADVTPRTADGARSIVAAKLLEDQDAMVRKAALLALSEMPSVDTAGAAVYASLKLKAADHDPGLADATAVAAARQDAGFLRAAFAAHPASDAVVGPAQAAPVNLIPNPSFEVVDGDAPKAWHVRDYSGVAQHALDAPGHTGARCLKISSVEGADASLYVDVPVEPNTDYRLSGWIKTRDLGRDTGLGALFNVHELQNPRVVTPAVTGTSDWRKVEVEFNSGPFKSVGINCLLGGWGHSRGTAWYDDVELTRVGSPALPGEEGRVVSRVINQYARRAPVDSVVATLAALRTADPALAKVLLGGLAAGWPAGKSPELAPADVNALQSLMQTLPPESRDRLLALAERWGKRDLFSAQAAAAVKELEASIADASADPEKRVESARRLIALGDGPESDALILKQINAKAPPEVQTGLLDALSESKDPAIAGDMVARWTQFAPAAQREATNLMLRKSQWTGALLDGLESGKIDKRDLLNQQWQALESNPDAKLSDRARALQKSAGHAPTADRKAIVEQFMPVAAQAGDPAKGRLVFEKNCMVCHTIGDRGGHVGPELTGIGAKPKQELLHKILDPNSSVEGTYRQWIVKAGDDVISGRIFAENRTSLELIDATGQRHVVQRENIQVLKATDKTLMPEGFEQLGRDNLADLLSYLETSKAKK